ncbi:uncharacterized protein LOC131206057 [Anopheles bellator]|uniref:uncharacterized protein LOC131206057 n=1 Tax=Anopheles bellator TaxID=139047 RepID=UPI0026470FCE|nr:uncharacterized protein LOC131206057 [Anopheles bellator]
MRNCFIQRCDIKHRDHPKRAMFNIPKDPEKFEQWRQALPKHRPLRIHDRVCEKHFKPSDIVRDWIHNINGREEVLPRRKPSLLPTAVPYYEEPAEAVNVKRRKTETKRGKQVAPEAQDETTPTRRRDKAVSCVKEKSIKHVLSNDGIMIMEISAGNKETRMPEPESSKPALLTMELNHAAVFEELYDNIFEVELPSILWGFHRDPERKFVAFTRLGWHPDDINSAAKHTTLLIEDSLRYRVWHEKKLVFDYAILNMEDQNAANGLELISRLLENLEEKLLNSQDVSENFHLVDVKA